MFISKHIHRALTAEDVIVWYRILQQQDEDQKHICRGEYIIKDVVKDDLVLWS